MAPSDDARSAALNLGSPTFIARRKAGDISFGTATDNGYLSAVLRSAFKFKCNNPSAIFTCGGYTG